ncbi:MAG TPA: alanine--glyoxylate aminotransferase family protein [Chloroflexia bacterium]|nr:alanine--glyoxylate aminotransferase family protein [Chloroflexia bacterium]
MQLRIPGPTPVPAAVRAAGERQMINHRGTAFHDLLRDVTERAKPFFGTSGDLLIFPASGTGGLEASIVNCFSPGDQVLALSCGHFGDRYADIAAAYGLEVIRLTFEWGQPVEPDVVRRALAGHPQVRGILLTHNETSTGVQNPVAAIGALAREFDRLLLVDSISAVGGVEFCADAWGVDVAITASQKAWMTPPGLTLLAVSGRAWAAYKQARLPRYYFDFGAARKYLEHWETPYTPAVSLLFQLQAALQLMHEEGPAAIFARHQTLRNYVRERVRVLGLELLAADAVASRTVTALVLPNARQILADLRIHGVELAGGQGPLEGRLLRIGHLGWASREDMAQVLDLLADLVAR